MENPFQLEKKRRLDMLELLNQLEVKGQLNIFILYKLMTMLHEEINLMEKQQSQISQGG